MLTPEQIAALRDAFGRIADPINDYLIEDIARRISEAGQLTSTAAYQVWRAQRLGMSRKEVKKRLRKLTGASNAEIKRLLTQSAEVGYDFDILKLPFVQAAAFEQNTAIQQIVSAAVGLAQEDFTNLTQTLGMIDPYGQAMPLQDVYRSCTDFAFKQIVTGAADYNTAIRRATKNLADKGVLSIDYKSGVHTTLEAAVRRNMMGGLGLMQEQITRQNYDDFGCDGWEITAHANSAPDHEPIQGRQYSDADYSALNNSLVRRIGTLNCGHAAFPIILGVTAPQYTDEELQKFREDNAKGITYGGRHYTGYEATQMQRELERAMRKQKRRILADEAAGDTEKLRQDQSKLQVIQQRYKNFSRAAGLRTEPERAQVAGFGRSQAARARSMGKTSKAVENRGKSVTIGLSKIGSEETPVKYIGKIDIEKYSRVAPSIRDNELVLTTNQEEHIIKRRGQAFFDKYSPYFKEIAEDPDFIFKDKQHENSAIVSKTLAIDGANVNLIIRLAIESDDPALKNSIITAILEGDTRYKQRLRNNIPLYKRD